uniref:C2H2-type domain-containing protein n=1 Tax=Salarias fasciatus TaxID=181472 RepID=A0A672HRN3_SALFA
MLQGPLGGGASGSSGDLEPGQSRLGTDTDGPAPSRILRDLKLASQLKNGGGTLAAEKPFLCRTCGKSFGQRRALLIHTRSHTGEKPHPCATCGKRFRQPGHLLVHKRTHTGEKPHRCGVCGKSFGQHGSLWNHMKTHSGEKPFCCQLCGKRFGNMLRHKHGVHSVL